MPVGGAWSIRGEGEDDGLERRFLEVAEITEVKVEGGGVGSDVVGMAGAEGKVEAAVVLG